MQVKITLRGSHGGELDCRTVGAAGTDPFDNSSVNDAVKDIALNCVFADGDYITITEIDG